MAQLSLSLKIPSQKTYFPSRYILFTQKQKVQVWPKEQEIALGDYLTQQQQLEGISLKALWTISFRKNMFSMLKQLKKKKTTWILNC